MSTTTFPFRFSLPGRLALTPLGVRDSNSGVEVGDGRLVARFGSWVVDTSLDNVSGASVQGPHNPVKAIGVRLSFSDRGLTFGSNARRTVCIEFHEPVTGIEPTASVPHPNLSVSVADCEGLVAALGG